MNERTSCDLVILTGEHSGEVYGAAVLEQLKRNNPHLRCCAMGSELLAIAGADIIVNSDGYDVVGFLPVLRRLPEFLRLKKTVGAKIRVLKPRVVLTIDYPGFNIAILRDLVDMRGECCFIHVVAPQVWAWRPKRAKKIAHACDRLACFFPFEPPYFTRFGCRADFIGHPMVDLVAQETPSTRSFSEADMNKPFLLLAPGSRLREVQQLLPVYTEAAHLLRAYLARRGEDIHIAISGAPKISAEQYSDISDFPVVYGQYRQLCAHARVAAIASGTACLEAALLATPHVICYRSDVITSRLMSRLLLTEYIGLSNIVHHQRVVPELLQDSLTGERLCAALLSLWQGEKRANCIQKLQSTSEVLGGTGAMTRLAEVVAKELG